MAALLVHFQDGHVGDGAEDEEEEEDGADGYINTDGWEATEPSGFGWIGSVRRVARGLEEVRFVRTELRGE